MESISFSRYCASLVEIAGSRIESVLMLSPASDLLVELSALPDHRAMADLNVPGLQFCRYDQLPLDLLAKVDRDFSGSLSPRLYGGGASVLSCAQSGRLEALCGFLPAERQAARFAQYRLDPEVGFLGPVMASANAASHREPLVWDALAAVQAAGLARAFIPNLDQSLLEVLRPQLGPAILQERPRTIESAARVVLCCGQSPEFVEMLLDAQRSGQLPINLVRVISHAEPELVVNTALAAGVDALSVLWDRATQSRDAFHYRVSDLALEVEPDLVILGSWLYLVPPSFIETLPELINEHPSYLPFDPQENESVYPDGSRRPALRGRQSLIDAINCGMNLTGVSTHRVGVDVDRGELLSRVLLPLPLVSELEPYDWRLAPHHLEQIWVALRTALLAGVHTWLEESWPPIQASSQLPGRHSTGSAPKKA